MNEAIVNFELMVGKEEYTKKMQVEKSLKAKAKQ